MVRTTNLRRAIALAVVAPALVVGVPSLSMAGDVSRASRSGDGGSSSGILSNLITVDTGFTRRAAAGDGEPDARGGILSNLVTVDAGFTRRAAADDSEPGVDDDGILSNLVTIHLGTSDRGTDRRNGGVHRGGSGILGNLLGDAGSTGRHSERRSIRVHRSAGGNGILGNLVSIDTGTNSRNSAHRTARTHRNGNGILSNLVSVDTASSRRDSDRHQRSSGILSNLVTVDLGSVSGDGDGGLLGLNVL